MPWGKRYKPSSARMEPRSRRRGSVELVNKSICIPAPSTADSRSLISCGAAPSWPCAERWSPHGGTSQLHPPSG